MYQNSVKSYLKENFNIDHTKSIYIRILFAKQSKRYIFLSTNIKVNPENWDKKKCVITSKEPDFERKNKIIHFYIKKANDIIDKYFFSNKTLTPDIFLKEFEVQSGNFYDFAHKEIDKMNIAKNTRIIYHAKIDRIEKFRPSLQFHEINESFIYNFRDFMLKQNHENTVKKNLQVFKEILTIAKNQNIIEKNPFDTIKIGVIKGNREPLTIEELGKLEIYYENTINFYEKHALRYFLCAAYTSLRISDIKQISKDYFKIIEGTKFIVLYQKKTNNIVHVPLIKKAENLLLNSKGNFIAFEKISEQKINQRLKQIAEKCKINKPVHLHIGRHTFATICLNNGVPIEVVSKILGHTQIKTTETYAKVKNELIIKNLEKLNKL